MVSSEPRLERLPFPTTVGRALTAVTQSRLALLRAHRELAEALEILATLQDGDDQHREGSGRAWHVLRTTMVLEELERVRQQLLELDDGPEAEDQRIAASEEAAVSRLPRMTVPDGDAVYGEAPPITERFIVAPDAGRVHRRRVKEGRRVGANTIIGEVRRGEATVLVRSPVAGTLLAWMCVEGENVVPGRPLAQLQPLDP
jgi:biotin carboxyl carrier protein